MIQLQQEIGLSAEELFEKMELTPKEKKGMKSAKVSFGSLCKWLGKVGYKVELIMNIWTIDKGRQVNILIGKELGKTTFLEKLFSESIPEDRTIPIRIESKVIDGVVFIPSMIPKTTLGQGEGITRLNYIFDMAKSLAKWEGSQLLIIDNPERGLHIDYQRRLISDILQLAPDVRLVMATHSPSIFYQGWIDCVVRANEG